MSNLSNNSGNLAPARNTQDSQSNNSPASAEASLQSVNRRSTDRRAGERRSSDRRRPENQGNWLGVERRGGERRAGERRTGDRRAAHLINAGRVVLATTFGSVPFVVPVPGVPGAFVK